MKRRTDPHLDEEDKKKKALFPPLDGEESSSFRALLPAFLLSLLLPSPFCAAIFKLFTPEWEVGPISSTRRVVWGPDSRNESAGPDPNLWRQLYFASDKVKINLITKVLSLLNQWVRWHEGSYLFYYYYIQTRFNTSENTTHSIEKKSPYPFEKKNLST